MIKFTFSIQNPWPKDSSHHTYFYYYRKLSKNKTFETQLYKSSPYDIFKLYLSLAWSTKLIDGSPFNSVTAIPIQ